VGGPGSRRGRLRPQRQDRARGAAHHLLGDAAHHQPADPAAADAAVANASRQTSLPGFDKI